MFFPWFLFTSIHHVLWSTTSSGNVFLPNSSRAHEKLIEAVLQTKAPWQQREKQTSKAHCRLSQNSGLVCFFGESTKTKYFNQIWWGPSIWVDDSRSALTMECWDQFKLPFWLSDHGIYPATIQHSNGIPRVPIRNRSTNGGCSNAILRLPKCDWRITTSWNFASQICWPHFSERIWKEDVPRIFGDLLPKDATKKKMVAANHN